MRELKAKDIFGFSRVLIKCDVKEDIKSISLKANNFNDLKQDEVGFELLFSLFEKMTTKKAEGEIFTFFADLFEMSKADVENMDSVEFIDKALEVANVPKWKSFFSRVAGLMSSM